MTTNTLLKIIDEPHQPRQHPGYRGRAAVVTLGCAKNQVDSEIMVGALLKAGFEITRDLESADVAVVNTCGFLKSSVQESIDCILELAELKERGQLRKLIVAGCMVERYQGDIRASLPEVDSFVSVNAVLDVARVATGELEDVLDQGSRPYFLYDERMPRELSTLKHTAYVKISEGCNRPCTFCIIPRIRGKFRSRNVSSILREADDLALQGVKEIVLVAQDLTAFGEDHARKESLEFLLRELDQTGKVPWIRLLYAYPLGINEGLIRSIGELPSVCEYLDLPFQHVSDGVLKAMQRPRGKYAPRQLVDSMHSWFPELHLRTTFIVGFPGETEQDIEELEQFIKEGHFSHVGVFTYSAEQGTPSYDLPKHVPEKEKKERRARLMRAQKAVYEKRMKEYIGRTIPVIVEGLHEDSDLLLTGRTRFQAPEVDGAVILNNSDIEEDPAQLVGSIRQVKITDVAGYDLVGTVMS